LWLEAASNLRLMGVEAAMATRRRRQARVFRVEGFEECALGLVEMVYKFRLFRMRDVEKSPVQHSFAVSTCP
jgi:hypothetical protein